MSQKYAGEPSETRQTAKGCPKGSEAYQWGQENDFDSGPILLPFEITPFPDDLPKTEAPQDLRTLAAAGRRGGVPHVRGLGWASNQRYCKRKAATSCLASSA
jgi:hypothetical protein